MLLCCVAIVILSILLSLASWCVVLFCVGQICVWHSAGKSTWGFAGETLARNADWRAAIVPLTCCPAPLLACCAWHRSSPSPFLSNISLLKLLCHKLPNITTNLSFFFL